jgi:hypothetical protein
MGSTFGDSWTDYLPGGYVLRNATSDDPAREGGQYEGLDRSNFNLPGYDQQQGRLSGYLGQVDARQAPHIGPYQQAGQSDFRGQQDRLSSLLMDRANGNNSVADMQMRQGLDAANQQQRSLMASARPSNVGMAMLTGSQNMANQAMGITGQAGMARAQEAQMAANSLGGLLAQGRGADENLSMFNAGQENQRAYGQAGMNQQQMGMNDAARLGYLGQSLNAAQAQQQGGMGYEQNRTQRYGAAVGVPTQGEVWRGGLAGLGGMALGGG